MPDHALVPEGSPGPAFSLPADVINNGGKPVPGQAPLAPNTDARLSAVESTTADALRRITDLET